MDTELTEALLREIVKADARAELWEFFSIFAIPCIVGCLCGLGVLDIMLSPLIWPILQVRAWLSRISEGGEEEEFYRRTCFGIGFMAVGCLLGYWGFQEGSTILGKPTLEITSYDKVHAILASEWYFALGLPSQLWHAAFGEDDSESAKRTQWLRLRNAALFWHAFSALRWSDLWGIPFVIVWWLVRCYLGGAIVRGVCAQNLSKRRSKGRSQIVAQLVNLYYVTCPTCQGKRTLSQGDLSSRCSTCYGTGKVPKDK